MKGTENFKKVIKAYLDERAKKDELFAKSYAKEKKNIDDCITYILNYVKRVVVKASQMTRFSDSQFTTTMKMILM